MSRNTKEIRPCSKSSRGFTLAELLVALFVLSMMLALAGTLLRSFILQTGKTRYTYAERAMKFYWLNSVISSAFYYIVRAPDKAVAENREFIEFFNGQPESMAFITSSPVTIKGIALERLYFKDNAIYLNETPIFSPNNDYQDPEETVETKQTLILEKIQSIRFTYRKRIRRSSGAVQPATEAVGAIGMPMGNAENSSSKVMETDRLDGEIPAGVRLSAVFEDDRQIDYCFIVQSNFPEKKSMTYGSYHQF